MDLMLSTNEPFEVVDGFEEIDENEYELYYPYDDIDIDLDTAVEEFLKLFKLNEQDVKFEYQDIEDFTVCRIEFKIGNQAFEGRIV